MAKLPFLLDIGHTYPIQLLSTQPALPGWAALLIFFAIIYGSAKVLARIEYLVRGYKWKSKPRKRSYRETKPNRKPYKPTTGRKASPARGKATAPALDAAQIAGMSEKQLDVLLLTLRAQNA